MGVKEGFQARKARVTGWLEEKPTYVLARRTLQEYGDDNATRLAAALSYYGLFSLAPLLLIAVAVAGLVFGEAAAQGQISNTLGQFLGEDSAAMVESMVAASDRTGAGILATVIGLVALLFGASRVFLELEDAMNTIWEIEEKDDVGLKEKVIDRLTSFALVVAVGLIFLAFLVASALIPVAARYMEGVLPGSAIVWRLVHAVLAVAVATLLFAILFKFLPDAQVAWKDVGKGAAVTAVLFALGMIALGIYIGRSGTTGTYGAAGSLIAVLLWMYVSAAIFLLGAEFTQVYANMHGSRIKSDEGAKPRPGESPSTAGRPSEPGDGREERERRARRGQPGRG